MDDLSSKAPHRVALHEIAHSRAGDKGDRLNLSLIAYREDFYTLLREHVTIDRVRDLFADRHPGAVSRYELPRLHALNFVIDNVLDGGVNASLNLDGHGKSLSFRLLGMEIDVDSDTHQTIRNYREDLL